MIGVPSYKKPFSMNAYILGSCISSNFTPVCRSMASNEKLGALKIKQGNVNQFTFVFLFFISEQKSECDKLNKKCASSYLT